MFTWLMENMATIIVSAVLVAVVAAVIASMVRGKRKGRSACGCGCTDCPAGSSCAMKGTRRPAEKETIQKSKMQP